mmetsp:Transcript_13575/g.25621  ORF Transcript_13575/g.25621 Transcript_13575/m.25621 type:complete len:310 (-) Transcript_13575:34-963(-)
MGYDHSELGIAGSTGVSATILVIVTMLCVFEAIKQKKHMRYPEAQIRLIYLLFAPVFIGWLTFGILYEPESERIIAAILFGYKASYLLIFNRYCERLLGWTDKGGVYVYSQEKSISSLQTLGEHKHKFICACLGKIPLRTREQAEYFLKRTRILVAQFVVILLIIGVLVIILEFATPKDYYHYGQETYDSAFTYISIMRSISTIVATYTVFLYSTVLNSIPRLKALHILSKFAIVKFAILLPELQPQIISIFSYADVISDDYSKEEQVSFINSILVIDEMLIVAFVQLLVFDPTEYNVHRDEESQIIPA